MKVRVILLFFLFAFHTHAAFAGLKITRQPQNQIVWVGNQASFSVAAKGAKKITYQWQKDGEDLIGETKSTLRIKKTIPSDRGSYNVIVSSGSTTLESEKAILVVQREYTAESEVFDDPDSAKGIYTGEEYGNLFSEVSTGKLRFRYSSGIDNQEETAYWFWTRSPQRKKNFDVKIDARDSTRGKLQFVATCDPGGLSYRIERNGSSATFNAGSWGYPPLQVKRVYHSTSSTEFSFRLVYDTSSKVRTLKAYYDEDGPVNGENWVLLQTVKNPNFITGKPILIGVCYNNNESGELLDGNNVTVDNFEAR